MQMTMEADKPLTKEIEYFNANLKEWLTIFPGRVVLVRGTELIGVFDTEKDALTAGARLYGIESYLIRRVLPEQPSHSNLALCLGMISAAPR